MSKSYFSVLGTSFQSGVIGLLVAFGAGCSSGTTGPNNCGDPNGVSTRQDGDCCEFSINCQAGSICNDPVEDLYDSTKASKVCIKVVCSSSADCDQGKECSLEKICNAPVCQTDAECSGGTTCQSGACRVAPNAADVTSCSIATRSGSIRQGASLDLIGIAKNQNGAVLPGIGFDWMSSNDNVVAVSNETDKATGGTAPGKVQITASVSGKASVTCTGLELTNFPNVAAGSLRVVLVADDTGAPVEGADVTVVTSGNTLTGTTDATGAATVTAGSADSVTVVKAGYQYVTVLSPGTNDILLPLPRLPDETRAGGFRGSVDLSQTKRADIQLGIAGPALPSNLLDFGLEGLLGDGVKTVIDAPELGLNMEAVDLPGGVMLGLGNKKFTADGPGLRCQGDVPSASELGCYVARAPAGPGAAWALAGQLKLSQVTSIANQLSSAFGAMNSDDVPIGDVLTAVLPLLRSLNHGVHPALNIVEYPKVKADASSSVDCSDASQANYEDNCRGDFARYAAVDLAASQKLGVLSRVSVPALPTLPGAGDGCAGAAVLVSGAILPGRGLIPLGLTAGLDVLEAEAPDCRVAGAKKPFGANSPDLPDGQMPLAMAPPHSGIEGSKIALLLVAIDPDNLSGSGFQLNAVVDRVASVSEEQSMSSRTFLPYPRGTLTRGAATFAFQGAITGATVTRFEIQKGDDTWLVYAPGDATSVVLPNVAAGRAILTDSDATFVQALKWGGPYKSIWEFGSGKTLDRLIDEVEAFVVQECKSTGSPCTVQ